MERMLLLAVRVIFDDEIIETAGDNLRWVHSPGAGVEHFLTENL